MYATAIITMLVLTCGTVGRAMAQGKKHEPGNPAPSADAALVDIAKLMTGQEFREAGLAKLSPEELAALNRWLSSFATRLLSAKEKAASSCAEATEAKINGEFKGWQGDSIYKLTNGQIWQQATYSYSYTYKYSPGVLIYPSAGGCKMKVEDAEPVAVRRIK